MLYGLGHSLVVQAFGPSVEVPDIPIAKHVSGGGFVLPCPCGVGWSMNMYGLASGEGQVYLQDADITRMSDMSM